MLSVIRTDHGTAAPTAPSPPEDAAARILLQRAQGAIQKWPEGFPGFRARLLVTLDGRERAGSALVGPQGEVEVEISDEAARDWANAVLAEIAAERVPRFFKDGDGRFPIAFEAPLDAAGGGPGSRLVVHRGVHGLAPIRYELDERARLQACERVERGERRVETYESFCRATPGRILPARRSTVVYDAHGLVRTELVEDTHLRVSHTWLPATR
ncbi:MAG TPA: DUF3386 family protein [Methylomirabilota bacterium]|nr:DUF3386 family protein [Methylomirabilota bacterium]